jgi:hypothetical protein
MKAQRTHGNKTRETPLRLFLIFYVDKLRIHDVVFGLRFTRAGRLAVS